MHILINAIRLSSAGGLRLGINLLQSFDRTGAPEDRITFLCPYQNYSGIAVSHVEREYLPDGYDRTIKWKSAQKWALEMIERYKPDIIFNLCNIPLETNLKQLLLLHWPYAAFDEEYIWKKMSFFDLINRKIRLYLIKKNFHYVDHLTVQTNTMKKRLGNRYISGDKITVIPSSFETEMPGGFEAEMPGGFKKRTVEGQPVIEHQEKKRIFLYLSNYYSHKNHSVLIEVAKIIKKKKLNYQIQMTLDESDPKTRSILKSIKNNNIEEQIINIGVVPQDKVNELYKNSYAIINPSLLESFGLTYLEAASQNRLVLASDMDFVKETMKDAAIYFNPFDPESIIEAMKLSADQDVYRQKLLKSREIIDNWSSWDHITEQYLKLLKSV